MYAELVFKRISLNSLDRTIAAYKLGGHFPKSNDIQHMRADQSLDGAIGCFGLSILYRGTGLVWLWGGGPATGGQIRFPRSIQVLRSRWFGFPEAVKHLQHSLQRDGQRVDKFQKKFSQFCFGGRQANIRRELSNPW